MSGTYNSWVVLLSLWVAILASYTALDLASRIAASSGAAALAWLLGGAFAMGTGIWSMHFIGLLAFSLPIAVGYDVLPTFASMAIAVIISGFALNRVAQKTLTAADLLLGGLLMGIGISSMHYMGMAAMNIHPSVRYDPLTFAASVVLGIAASLVALWMAFTLRAQGKRHVHLRVGSAIVMGLGVSGMHYTGMAAARFAPNTVSLGGALGDITGIAAALAVITILILCATLALSVLDARMESRTAQMAVSLRRANAELQHMVLHDTLTLLPNRVLLEDRLQQAIEECRRGNAQCAVLFVDLDRFKTLNDSLGHFAGDSVLRTVADRLRSAVRTDDTVSRLGGDEFVILLKHIHRLEDAEVVARKAMAMLEAPIVIDGQELRISSSIGISVFPAHGEDSTRLIANADTAMYHVKKSGRCNYVFFSPEMGTFFPQRLVLENELRTALENNEFVVHYQPKVDMRSGRIVGMEALVRWNHPRRGLVMPTDFIAFAEETGLIVPLGRWVLHQACFQSRAWQKRGIRDLTMAVNISGVQFQQPNFVETVSYALAASNLAPRFLELEITETVVMQNAPAVIGMLNQLHRMGVSLSIDDFGTGYSSLNYLKRFPIHKLKIDQSFIRDISMDSDDAAIVNAIIALAHSLRLRVVAEGVERQEQLNFLRVLGNDEYQGHLHSKPMPARELEPMLLAHAETADLNAI